MIANYKFDRKLRPVQNGQKMQREARYVQNRGSERNLHLSNVNDALGRGDEKRAPPVVRLSRQWLGRKVGEGAFGAVFLTRPSRHLEELRKRAVYTIENEEGARAGQTVCVKIARDQGNGVTMSRDKFVLSSLKEASFHKYLATAPCVPVRFCKEVCAGKYVPRFYWGGMVFANSKRVYVTCMGLAPGEPLEKYLKKTRGWISPKLYVQLEKAVAAMWLLGFAHADLHTQNLFVDARTGRVSIIDFGFGTMFSKAIVEDLRKKIPMAIAVGVRSLGETWLSPKNSPFGANALAFVNRVQHTRTPNKNMWYNPDGYALMSYYSRVPPRMRSAINGLRRRAWGFSANSTANSKTKSKS